MVSNIHWVAFMVVFALEERSRRSSPENVYGDPPERTSASVPIHGKRLAVADVDEKNGFSRFVIEFRCGPPEG
jgi:hypothetical protein